MVINGIEITHKRIQCIYKMINSNYYSRVNNKWISKILCVSKCTHLLGYTSPCCLKLQVLKFKAIDYRYF